MRNDFRSLAAVTMAASMMPLEEKPVIKAAPPPRDPVRDAEFAEQARRAAEEKRQRKNEKRKRER